MVRVPSSWQDSSRRPSQLGPSSGLQSGKQPISGSQPNGQSCSTSQRSPDALQTAMSPPRHWGSPFGLQTAKHAPRASLQPCSQGTRRASRPAASHTRWPPSSHHRLSGSQTQVSTDVKISSSAPVSSARFCTTYAPTPARPPVPPASATAESSSPLACAVIPIAKVRIPRARSAATWVTTSSSSPHVSSPSVMRITASASSGSPNTTSTPSSAARMGVWAVWSGGESPMKMPTALSCGATGGAAWQPAPRVGNRRAPIRARPSYRTAMSTSAPCVNSQRPPAMLDERSTRKRTSGLTHGPLHSPRWQRRPSPQGIRRDSAVHSASSGSGAQIR